MAPSYQSKILRWYVRNENIQKDLNIQPAGDVIAEQKEKYHSRLSHPNHLARVLTRLCSRSRIRRNDLLTQRLNLGTCNPKIIELLVNV